MRSRRCAAALLGHSHAQSPTHVPRECVARACPRDVLAVRARGTDGTWRSRLSSENASTASATRTVVRYRSAAPAGSSSTTASRWRSASCAAGPPGRRGLQRRAGRLRTQSKSCSRGAAMDGSDRALDERRRWEARGAANRSIVRSGNQFSPGRRSQEGCRPRSLAGGVGGRAGCR